MRCRSLTTIAALLVAATASGCADGTGPVQGFVVTGHTQNNTHTLIPLGTRLLAVWGVSSGTPDYGYVFGEGTINRLTGTFQIGFDRPPPLEALNAGGLGVGFIIATTDQSLKDGDVISGGSLTGLIGVAGQHAVIFVRTHEEAVPFRAWAAEFDTGYGVGVGVKVPGEVFEKFVPTDPSNVVLIIDDLENIDVVNWT